MTNVLVPKELLQQVNGALDLCLLALSEASPCVWEDCNQMQIESCNAAEKRAKETVKAVKDLLYAPRVPVRTFEPIPRGDGIDPSGEGRFI